MQNLFREIHKNSWLKRVDSRKVLQKKSEKYWVVFCVHDDCEAFLEGFLEPRAASTHSPDWSISLQTTQHVSHALVVSHEQEFEFVIALGNDVARFSAPSWELMLEWVETLRSKLREMKILSPKENLYSKLPEIRPPLLPTRDPTSPLPATPPIPAGLIPGIERIQPSTSSNSHSALAATSSSSSVANNNSSTSAQPSTSTAMSNTSIQNIMNLLSNPLSAVSKALNQTCETSSSSSSSSTISSVSSTDPGMSSAQQHTRKSNEDVSASTSSSTHQPQVEAHSLAKTFANNVLSELHEFPSTSGISLFQHDSNNSNEIDLDCSSNESNSISIQTEALVIPRPHTSRTSSSNASKNKQNNRKTTSTTSFKSNKTKNVVHKATVAENPHPTTAEIPEESTGSTNITIIQVSNTVLTATTTLSDTSVNNSNKDDYKSNVQIIPSNISPPPLSPIPSIIQEVLVQQPIDQSRYSSPTRKKVISLSGENSINRVQVNSSSGDYGKIKPLNLEVTGRKQRNNQSKTVIISTAAAQAPTAITTVVENSAPVTNISIITSSPQHYEEVFLSTSAPLPAAGMLSQNAPITYSNHIQRHNNNNNNNIVNIVNTNQSVQQSATSLFLNKQQRSTSHNEIQENRLKLFQNSNNNKNVNNNVISINNSDKENTIAVAAEPCPETSIDAQQIPSTSTRQVLGSSSAYLNKKPSSHEETADPVVVTPAVASTAHQRPVLQRGQTEMVINRGNNIKSERTARSSRVRTANNSDVEKLRMNGTTAEDQRKRSSSTSDAAAIRNRPATSNDTPRRLQQPPQPYRPDNQPSTVSASGRMTLREQQVFQLRREMMHPGGVRLQLRRKDCVGSIAWVEAFGGVWVAGWKQKEHPMLYNALHIGDQLVAIAGTPVANPADANKLIRAAPGLFVEMLIRRVPFGRVYAIRREMEGQCLGLIRDGNTAIVVDVVPNSLCARFGLPPKTQSCDKLSLTFWVLTEINGRPLNLFFKDNEIKDRLNSVGRDISILVQPSDLVAKLKKQLKSLRGHKDFIVQ